MWGRADAWRSFCRAIGGLWRGKGGVFAEAFAYTRNLIEVGLVVCITVVRLHTDVPGRMLSMFFG